MGGEPLGLAADTAAFVGPVSTTAAHVVFITYSPQARGLRNSLTVGPRELPVLLCTLMMRAAELERYEQFADTFAALLDGLDTP